MPSFGARLWLVGLVGLVAAAEPASAAVGAGGGGSASDDLASALVGTWEGTKSGAEGGKFESREWRIVFEESKASAVIGTKQYKQPNGKWSKRERVNAVIDGTGHIWAVDTDGVLNGSLSDTRHARAHLPGAGHEGRRRRHRASRANGSLSGPAEEELTMVPTRVKHPSLKERRAQGRSARQQVPRSSSAGWEPAADRFNPVALLEEQNVTREPDLVPVRHGRMMVSPFTFYRGAAKIMAADLADTPSAGLTVQLCGDAHLSNFGAFGSPERNLVFDVNDFDETLPGPFEYDVKRLAASITIAGRNNRFSPAEVRAATAASVEAYRTGMQRFAEMSTLDVWYANVSEHDIVAATDEAAQSVAAGEGKEMRRRIRAAAAKAHTRDSLQALSKLAELSDGRYRIVSQPPIVVAVRDVQEAFGLDPEVIDRVLHDQFREYRRTLQDDRRHLLERFELVDLARKVVGVGSVGMRAYILLLQGRDSGDPLFLQVKEATASVLEDHLPKSPYHQHGERVVQGQRLMQATSDIFLGWTKGIEENRYLYWRQLRDMKGSADVESLTASGMTLYARLCGFTLARAHARSGDSVVLASYLGRKDSFDKAIVDFASRYADQNEKDYEQFVTAIRSGRLEAREGL